jgi:hypothetical protein
MAIRKQKFARDWDWQRASLFKKTVYFESTRFLSATNYSLKRIAFQGMTNKSFEMIHRLNRAGRRYLIEDSTSKEACINVLAQVNDDLDCLYFHLRENPVLFTRMTCNADCTQHVPSGTKLQTGTSDGVSINVSSKED